MATFPSELLLFTQNLSGLHFFKSERFIFLFHDSFLKTGRWCWRTGDFGRQLPVWSLGGAGWLQRRAGGGAAFLSSWQNSSSSSYWRFCPFLDGGGIGGGDVFVVETFNAIVKIIHLHLLHLDRERDIYCYSYWFPYSAYFQLHIFILG